MTKKLFAKALIDPPEPNLAMQKALALSSQILGNNAFGIENRVI
ncbi:Uncharacterised protein [Mannheimia haemolytica]|uniref:Uncharacterized protein n=1 Tax=Mannheimia haemolytica TaxID=75985 RepID=A0A378N6S4_MANHA|nr:Uncharacterised protein [Mannheimia haemolytica]